MSTSPFSTVVSAVVLLALSVSVLDSTVELDRVESCLASDPFISPSRLVRLKDSARSATASSLDRDTIQFNKRKNDSSQVLLTRLRDICTVLIIPRHVCIESQSIGIFLEPPIELPEVRLAGSCRTPSIWRSETDECCVDWSTSIPALNSQPVYFGRHTASLTWLRQRTT